MNCEKYQKMISDRLDGRLSRRKEKKLDRHLAGCPLCRDYLEAQEIIQREAFKIGEIDYPPEWWPQFEQNLKEKLILEGGLDGLQAVEGNKNKGNKNDSKKANRLVLRPVAVRALSLVLVVATVVTIAFLIIYKEKGRPEELPLAMMLSYEESYLNLNQMLADDEAIASEFVNSLEESIIGDTIQSGSENAIIDFDNNLPANDFKIELNKLQKENHNPEEGV
ncbi:MAG: zf-HC2 domain-containing protein [Acidobacteriota bacterium]|nr:zf-HC2 domain-containing protein [Acidobacteriota bacterium]